MVSFSDFKIATLLFNYNSIIFLKKKKNLLAFSSSFLKILNLPLKIFCSHFFKLPFPTWVAAPTSQTLESSFYSK